MSSSFIRNKRSRRETLPHKTLGGYNSALAGVAELVDALDLKSGSRKGVRVRFPSSAQKSRVAGTTFAL